MNVYIALVRVNILMVFSPTNMRYFLLVSIQFL